MATWENQAKNSSSFEAVDKNSAEWATVNKGSVRSKFFSPDFLPFQDDAPFQENDVVVGTEWANSSKN